MNLYDLHHKPEKLHGHDKADKQVPIVIWDKYNGNKNEIQKYEDVLITNPKTAYLYTSWILKDRLPKAEKIIGQSKYAFDYWRHVIHGKETGERFPEGEDSIAKDLGNAIGYTMHTKHGIESLEKEIAKDPKRAEGYIGVFPFRKEAMEKLMK